MCYWLDATLGKSSASKNNGTKLVKPQKRSRETAYALTLARAVSRYIEDISLRTSKKFPLWTYSFCPITSTSFNFILSRAFSSSSLMLSTSCKKEFQETCCFSVSESRMSVKRAFLLSSALTPSARMELFVAVSPASPPKRPFSVFES